MLVGNVLQAIVALPPFDVEGALNHADIGKFPGDFNGAIGRKAVQHDHIVAEGEASQARLNVQLLVLCEEQYTRRL